MDSNRDSPLPSFIAGSYAARLGVALSFDETCYDRCWSPDKRAGVATLEEDVADDITALSGTCRQTVRRLPDDIASVVRSTSRLPVFPTDRTGETATTGGVRSHESYRPVSSQCTTYTEKARFAPVRTGLHRGQRCRARGTVRSGPAAVRRPRRHARDGSVLCLGVDHPIVAVVSPVPGDEDRALVYRSISGRR